MNKKYIVNLTDEEREYLNGSVTKGKASAHVIRHANILLKADADSCAWTDEQIAEAFSAHKNTAAGIRQRFVEDGLETALCRKKQSAPSHKKILDGEGEARLIAMSCSEPPEGYSRWTLRLLADKAVGLEIAGSVSYETVRQTLKKMSWNLTFASVGLFRRSRTGNLWPEWKILLSCIVSRMIRKIRWYVWMSNPAG